MIDILSLPRRNTAFGIQQTQTRVFGKRNGLPINSLPGWEHIPLINKLPMLKCPGNQVVFTKNKIGQDFKSTKQEFDSSVSDNIPEYNPLHDVNLKTFYSNERNLKRLRENGEITEDNYVICTLKDFNEYRQALHKSHLYYVLQEYRRREAEQHDRSLIANAEAITKRDHMNLTARQHSYEDIIDRKKRLDDARRKKVLRLMQITEARFRRLDNLAEMQRAMMDHRKMLNSMRMQQHLDVCHDLQRKHLIKLKKLFQFKKERFNRNMRRLHKNRVAKATEFQIQSWQKRLQGRINHQKRMDLLITEVEKERRKFIENHKLAYREKWDRIQAQIKERSRYAMAKRQPKKRRRRRRKPKKHEPISFCDEYHSIFEGLLDAELCYALNAAITMEGTSSITFAADDPIYKAAQYILKYILKLFDKDLSNDACAFKTLKERLDIFIKDAKKFVIYKSTQIIKFALDRAATWEPTSGPNSAKIRHPSRVSHVSFSGVASTIGFGSYEIHPFVDVRSCADRRPTPAGSLASLVVSQIEEQLIQDKVKMPHLSRNEVVFIEHNVVKFKRELLVGVDKQVFAAIQCHFENQIMDIREELLELGHEFLIDQAVRGILSYAVNPLNFQSALRLAVSVLATEVIWELQQEQLRPVACSLTHPTTCSANELDRMALCP